MSEVFKNLLKDHDLSKMKVFIFGRSAQWQVDVLLNQIKESEENDISDLISQQKREVINQLVLSKGIIMANPDHIEIAGTLFENLCNLKEVSNVY
jgi:hypothetical protein